MNYSDITPNTQEEVLLKQLKKSTSLYAFIGKVGFIVAVPIIYVGIREGFQTFQTNPLWRPIFYAIITCLCFAGFCQFIWYMLKPENNKWNALICFYVNILLVPLFAAVGIGLSVYTQSSIILLAWLFLVLFFMLDIVKINRLLKAIYENPSSEQAKQQASPCPQVFYMWNVQKSLFWAPFVLLIFGLLVGAIACGLAGTAITQKGFLICLIISSLISLPIAVIFWPLSLAAYFTKQTLYPSATQRFIRRFAVVNFSRKPLPPAEINAFRWWLSHPGQEWPLFANELFEKIDTSLFDWQNPAKWSF